jgi:orotidine-5'-phosphate decarboxylase
MKAPVDAHDRLIVALDLEDVDGAKAMVRNLQGIVNFFKIGISLQTAPGASDFIRSMIDKGTKVFLDYKYYDIPETMTKAVARASALGATFLTIHGSRDLIRAAVRGRSNNLKLFNVTILTSMDNADVHEMGYSNHTVEELVIYRARISLQEGCDGVIASGAEAKKIKEVTQGKLLVATPGIRPEEYFTDDQKRRTTPREAVSGGADYLVIGRPITEPINTTPQEASQRIIDEMQNAFDAL